MLIYYLSIIYRKITVWPEICSIKSVGTKSSKFEDIIRLHDEYVCYQVHFFRVITQP